jgi:hypothetical protein
MGNKRQQRDSPPSGVSFGICSACNLAESCSFRRDTSRPVLICDEFDERPGVPRGLCHEGPEIESSAESLDSG